MIGRCLPMLVKLLQILNEVVYPLRIEKLVCQQSRHMAPGVTYFANNLRRLRSVDGTDVLDHGPVVIGFLV